MVGVEETTSFQRSPDVNLDSQTERSLQMLSINLDADMNKWIRLCGWLAALVWSWRSSPQRGAKKQRSASESGKESSGSPTSWKYANLSGISKVECMCLFSASFVRLRFIQRQSSWGLVVVFHVIGDYFPGSIKYDVKVHLIISGPVTQQAFVPEQAVVRLHRSNFWRV